MEAQPDSPHPSQSTESANSPHPAALNPNDGDDELDVTHAPDTSHASPAPASITSKFTAPQDIAPQAATTDATSNSNSNMEETSSTPAAESSSKSKKKKEKILPMKLSGPLPALPSATKLPDLEDFNLRREQLKNPLFVAISKVLIVYGNAWQSATDLVDGIRHFNLANLGGRTPKGTVQGAISTGLALAAALGTFEPIEKQRMNGTTYYRMAAQALTMTDSGDDSDSDAEMASPKAVIARNPPVAPKPPPQTLQVPNYNKRTISGWSSSGSMSSYTTDDDDDSDSMPSISQVTRASSSSVQDHKSFQSFKRARTGSPSSNSSRGKTTSRHDILPNGLKKLPKGYVYDTEINQSALMNLSIDPLQTGEYIQHLSNINAMENNYPDRRADFKVDLQQEPSMFAVEQQVGYTYPRLRTSGRERLPKADCEDGFAVSDLKFRGGYLGRLFCVTDGHGGRACSSFVIATIPGAMQVILGKYRPKDLSLLSVQELIKSQITEAVRLIDKEYLDYKKQQYLLYKAKKIPNDPGSDGTTLIVNIFIDKWIININLGDSRTMVGRRDVAGRWNVDFYSEDHTPSLERLAQTIYANGGEFVTHDDKIIRFDPSIKNDKKHRQSLKEARIRVKDAASNLYGIPYRTRNGQCASVNLGACIGDVLYKLDPVKPVLSCKPDITFIDSSYIQRGFLLMASDGLWDYVQRGGKVQDQNTAVSQFVGDKLDRGWNFQRIVCTLADREGMAGLYSDPIQEYDDFTAILVSLDAKPAPPPAPALAPPTDPSQPVKEQPSLNGSDAKDQPQSSSESPAAIVTLSTECSAQDPIHPTPETLIGSEAKDQGVQRPQDHEPSKGDVSITEKTDMNNSSKPESSNLMTAKEASMEVDNIETETDASKKVPVEDLKMS
ncbi:Protein phosphatase 1L [Podila humilis]|nr:Protein phosphatase 1L [Podila humilis]